MVHHSRILAREQAAVKETLSVTYPTKGNKASKSGITNEIGATDSEYTHSLALFSHWTYLNLLQKQKGVTSFEVRDISVVVMNNEDAIESVYSYYVSGGDEISSREFGMLMRDCSVVSSTNSSVGSGETFTKKQRRKRRQIEKFITKIKGTSLKQHEVDLAFVRTTQAQSRYVENLIEEIREMKIEAAQRRQDTKNQNRKKQIGKKSTVEPPTMKKNVSMVGVPSTAVASSFLTRAGFVQALCIIAIQRYSQLNTSSASAKRKNIKGKSKSIRGSSGSTRRKQVYSVALSKNEPATKRSPAECLDLLLQQDLFPFAGSRNRMRLVQRLRTSRISHVLELNMDILCAEYARWAGVSSSLGHHQHDSERNLSLREWMAFLGSWHLLKVETEHRSIVDVASLAHDSKSIFSIGEVITSNPLAEESEALQEHGGDSVDADNPQNQPTHGYQVFRQPERVLTKRPNRRLSISEANQIFAVASSPAQQLLLADNKLFQRFCSWDKSKKKPRHHSYDQNGHEYVLTSKAWIEALCAVAVYQQPSPYLSLDEALEYLLQHILGGKRT